jgi:DNA repair photolyase
MNRLIATTGKVCPLGCIYCFASDPQYVQPLNITSTEYTEEEFKSYTLIHPSCDTELFLDVNQGFHILDNLLRLGKDVSFATKMPISRKNLNRLVELSDKYRVQGNVLNVTVSFTCTNSSPIWEPKVPHPNVRFNLLKLLYQQGIHTLINIRPLIPTIPESELAEIVANTIKYTKGYVSGTYWTTNTSDIPSLYKDVIIEEDIPGWMVQQGERWYRVYSPQQEQYLGNLISSKGSRLYDSSIEAVVTTKD